MADVASIRRANKAAASIVDLMRENIPTLSIDDAEEIATLRSMCATIILEEMHDTKTLVVGPAREVDLSTRKERPSNG